MSDGNVVSPANGGNQKPDGDFVATLLIHLECSERVTADDVRTWLEEQFARSDLGTVTIGNISPSDPSA